MDIILNQIVLPLCILAPIAVIGLIEARNFKNLK